MEKAYLGFGEVWCTTRLSPTRVYILIITIFIRGPKVPRRQKVRKRGYEYEMEIPRIKAESAAIVIDNHGLAHSTGHMAGNAITVCGVMLCAIKVKREISLRQALYS